MSSSFVGIIAESDPSGDKSTAHASCWYRMCRLPVQGTFLDRISSRDEPDAILWLQQSGIWMQGWSVHELGLGYQAM